MGSHQIFLNRAGSIIVARVESGQPSLVWVWKISLKNTKFFNFIPSGQKNLGGLAYYLQRVKSMLR